MEQKLWVIGVSAVLDVQPKRVAWTQMGQSAFFLSLIEELLTKHVRLKAVSLHIVQSKMMKMETWWLVVYAATKIAPMKTVST